MQQEARNTETHTRDWQSSTLRKNPVKFVKAGELQRSEFETVDQADQESEGQAGDDAKESSPAVVSPPEPTQENTEFGFFFDATPQTVTDTGLPDPIIRTQLSDFDDSSEDEVVFTGRKTGTRPIVIETSKEELREFLHAPQTVLSTLQHEPTAADVPATRNPRSEPSQNREQPHTQDTRKWTREDEDNMLADYIANMDTDYQEDIISHMQVELEGGIDVAQAAADSKSSAHGQDEADESLTQLDPTRPECALKEAQVQSSIDVLSRMCLDTEPDQVTDSSDNDDDDEDEDEDDDDVDIDSTDEFYVESDDEDLDTELLEDLAINYLADKKKGGRSGKVPFASATAFADALEADPYYGLDMMDFNRPSLQKKGKGKKPPALDMMFSDSDLEAHLHEVWQTDRKKKKARKQEREELRAQGLLGRSTGEADLKVKYSKGMNLEELITEIRSFLLSSNTTLALPAMTKHRRKTIHELANAMHLKSQSRGNGPSRFPILIKTSRTPAYTRKTISKVDDLLSGKKLNRQLYQSWGSDASKYTKTVKVKRGAAGGAVTYMDGDVVGGTAPEIGAGNKGRAMLEKMGWSSGTALGAINNKGILLPVAHVVKNSRTGLG
ncbi:squalene synthetase-like protein [Penicillium ochrochloron]